MSSGCCFICEKAAARAFLPPSPTASPACSGLSFCASGMRSSKAYGRRSSDLSRKGLPEGEACPLVWWEGNCRFAERGGSTQPPLLPSPPPPAPSRPSLSSPPLLLSPSHSGPGRPCCPQGSRLPSLSWVQTATGVWLRCRFWFPGSREGLVGWIQQVVQAI